MSIFGAIKDAIWGKKAEAKQVPAAPPSTAATPAAPAQAATPAPPPADYSLPPSSTLQAAPSPTRCASYWSGASDRWTHQPRRRFCLCSSQTIPS